MDSSKPEGTVWSEDDSAAFVDMGNYFVPDRPAQIDTLCKLLPSRQDRLLVMDLCCGEGLLAEAILSRYEHAIVYGYDGSPLMVQRAQERTARFGWRFQAKEFDLVDTTWRKLPWKPDGVVSSLAIHHLRDNEKMQLFADVFGILAPGGVFLIADLILPPSESARVLAAEAWDEAVKRQALQQTGHLEPYITFEKDRWNFFRYPDVTDRPAPLLDQLKWLETAGFADVDIFWMVAGHAIFGGRK